MQEVEKASEAGCPPCAGLPDSCCLTEPECTLRQLASDELHLAIKEEAEYWWRCVKIRVAIEGDENTKFFHAHGSHHLRKQAISTLEADGVQLSSYHDKAAALLRYYKTLLGTTMQPNLFFDIENYYPHTVCQLRCSFR